MLRAYKYRLYPTVDQRTLMSKHFGCVRWVYNWGLARKMEAWKEKKNLSQFDLSKMLPGMKKAEATEWLKEVNAQSLQQSLVHLDAAYVNFFRHKHFPKFKSKHHRQSFTVPQGFAVESGCVILPKIGSVKAIIDRTFKGHIKRITVSRSSTGKHFASVLVENGKKEPKAKRFRESTTVGVDVGLTHFATLSTGEKIENPRRYKKALKRLRRAQRQLSRSVKGSQNRSKKRHRVARIHERVVNQRKDFQHKLSTRLIRENQAVAVEDLNVDGMKQNRHLAQAISDAGWSTFLGMLEYKARWSGKTVLKIGRFEPSSKLCSCGVINRELKLSQRTWECASCGAMHDRDVLAANNIKRMALHPQNFLGRDAPEYTPVESGKSRSEKQES